MDIYINKLSNSVDNFICFSCFLSKEQFSTLFTWYSHAPHTFMYNFGYFVIII